MNNDRGSNPQSGPDAIRTRGLRFRNGETAEGGGPLPSQIHSESIGSASPDHKGFTTDISGPCALWTGPGDQDGYGYDGSARAHRVAWERVHGPIASGLVVRHLCNVRRCVNVAHLALGTHQDNVDDRAASGHTARGEQNGRAKLTVDQVRAIHIRAAAGDSSTVLARSFGVSAKAIRLIVQGKNWAHVAAEVAHV